MTTTSSISPQGAQPVPNTSENAARQGDEHSHIAPGEIAVGVIIGRASEYFDFFVYGIASVLVFPAVFFPFEARLEEPSTPSWFFRSHSSHGRSEPSFRWPSSGASGGKPS